MWPRGRNISLRLQFVLYVAIALIPLIVLNLLSQIHARQLRREAVLQSSMSLAETTTAAVQSYLEGIHDMEAAAVASFTSGRLSLSNADGYLKEMRTVNPQFAYLVMLDSNGRVFASDSSALIGTGFSHHKWFRSIMFGGRQWVVSDLITDSPKNGEVFIVAAAAKSRDGRPLALAGAVYPKALERFVVSHIPSEGHAGILDSRGRAIASSFPELARNPLARNRSYVPEFRAALAGKHSYFVDWRDPVDGVVRLGAIAPVERYGWVVVHMQPQETAMKPVTDAQRRDMAILLAFATLSLLLAWYFGSRVAAPIRQLTEDASQIAGDLAVRSHIERGDEIGHLAASFNAMASNLEVYSRVSQAATSILDLQPLLDSIAGEVCRATGYDLCAVGLLDERDGFLHFLGTSGAMGDQWRLARVAVGSRICGLAVAEKRPIVVHDCEELDQTCRDLLAPEGVVAGAAVPIMVGEEAIGALTVYSRHPRNITEIDVRLLSAIAAFAAIGIRNARTYEREHRVAATLQRSFLPDVPASIGDYEIGHLYKPALGEAEVGGDFYDFFRISQDRYGIVIGDVAGKGVSAAVTAVMTIYMLRGFAGEDPDPSVVLRRVNDALTRNIELASFVTIVYGVLNLSADEITFASAGHELPLLYRIYKHSVEWRVARGRAAGVLAGGDYQSHSVSLERGDVLLLYTDGVVDARRDREFFDRSGLEEAVLSLAGESSAQDLLDALLQTINVFSSGRQRDDIAMLAVRRT